MKNAGLTFSILISVVINLIPILGVRQWGWAPRDLILFYWVESVIIGVMWVIRIFTFKVGIYPFSFFGTIASLIGRIVISVPFVGFYGGWLFILGAGLLPMVFFRDQDLGGGEEVFMMIYEEGLAKGIYIAVISLTFSHLFYLYRSWFRTGNYKTMGPTEGAIRLCVRVIVLAALIAVINWGQERLIETLLPAVVAMVLLKVLFEVFFILYDHKTETVDMARQRSALS